MKKTLKTILLYSVIFIILNFIIIYIKDYYDYISETIFKSCDFSDGSLDKMQVFGLMGDYIGGVFGTLFSIFTVLLSAIAIYYAVKNNNSQIATQLKIETLNKENIIAQHKPFLDIDIALDGCTFSVSFTNMGLGPLSFVDFKIFNSTNTFKNFKAHFKNADIGNSESFTINYQFSTDNKMVLGSGVKKNMWNVKIELKGFKNEYNGEMIKYLQDLSNYKLVCVYSDIFDNFYEKEKDFEFMKETYDLG